MLLLVVLACQDPAPPAEPSSTSPDTHVAPEPSTLSPTVTTGVPGARLARLSHVQWSNSVEDLLYLEHDPERTEHFVDSAAPTWFENDRDVLDIGPTLWLQYQAAAETLSAEVTADSGMLEAIAPSGDRNTFVQSFGLRAFRRPLTTQEFDDYVALFDEGPEIFGTGDDFADGVHAVVAAMLQSPWFLYRGLGYRGVGDGTELDDYELAAKLSYALWNTMPDEELFAVAASGLTPARLDEQARRLLLDPRGHAMVADLHRQWLDVDRYENIYRSHDERYGEYLESTPYAMTLEVYAYVDRVYYEEGSVQELLSSRQTLVEDRLAALYGIDGVKGADNTTMQWVTLDPDERAGLFTLTGWLALQSDGSTEDLIHRGAYINHSVLCNDVPSPGVPVPPLPVDEEGVHTLRERIEAHTTPCGGACHADFINPVGFAFTEYDAFGSYQQTSDGLAVDATGAFELDAGPITWSTGVEFLEQISVSPQAHRCYADHLLTYLEGHRSTAAQQEQLDDLMTRSLGGEPILELVHGIVTDPAFRQRP